MNPRHRSRLVQLLAERLDTRDLELIDQIAQIATWRTFPGGEVVYRQGEPADSMGFVITGRLEVHIDRADGERFVAGHVAAGETIGEIALFTGGTRSASLVAVRETVIAEIQTADFTRTVDANPALGMRLAGQIIDRLARRQRGVEEPAGVRTIALVSHDPKLSIAAFGRRLELALLQWGRTALVTRETFSDRLAAGDGPAEIHDALEEFGRSRDFVLCLTEPHPSVWTRVVLEHSDVVLVVAAARSQPAPGEVESLLESGFAPVAERQLILLHKDGDQELSGTSRWLEARHVTRHHHVGWRGEDGIRRIARVMAGRSVGLVLAGGGARGFAHIGAIRALREAGIPIDAVGGTSIGSIVGGFVAFGWRDEQILTKCRQAFANEQPMDDFTFPLMSLIRGKKLNESLSRHLGETWIEDLWLPYFAVSCNLSRKRIHVHEKGLLRKAIRASISLPGILPPAISDAELFIDGGVLDNMPVEPMKKMNDGPIIAIDLSVAREHLVQRDEMPSPFEYLESRLPFRESIEVPNLMTVLVNSTTLGRRQIGEGDLDLYLNPPVDGFDLLDWYGIHDLVEVGYEHARERIAAWEGRADLILRRELFDSRCVPGSAEIEANL